MIILPAIDLLGGQCVRLTRGDYGTAERVAADAAETARAFEAAGASLLHLVDLDGARTGKPVNLPAVRDILGAIGIPAELGGGIRDREGIEEILGCGIARVILGSAALRDPAFVREAVRAYGDKIAVGIDARDGFVSIEGWLETSDVPYLAFAKRMEDIGVRTLIFTDIARDGTLAGPNLEQLRALAREVSCDVTASGGIRDAGDIRALAALGLYGAICGKSLYSGTLRLEEALSLARGEEA